MVTVGPGSMRLNAEHYAWAHFAQVVRPGAVRVASAEADGAELRTAAFANPDGPLALVVLNDSWHEPRRFTVQASGSAFADALPPASVASYHWHARG